VSDDLENNGSLMAAAFRFGIEIQLPEGH